VNPEDVPGRISNEAGAVLRSLARRVPSDRLIVEIGAFKGKSTCFLACGSMQGRGARVVSIDPWDLPGNTHGPDKLPGLYTDPANQADHARHVKACGVAHLVTQVKAFSGSAKLPPRTSIGLLWIDGAHDYESVMSDVRRYSRRLARGGWIVFDDYTSRCPGVVKAVKELMADQRAWRAWNTRDKPLAVGVRR
jgi:predicted O-methyltransferase YrrM